MTQQATQTPDSAARPAALAADKACECGRPILFARSVKSGKAVPLDAGAMVAVVFTDDKGVRWCQSAADYFWAVCQDANHGRVDAAFQQLLNLEGWACQHHLICTRVNNFTAKARIDAAVWTRQRDAMRAAAEELRGPMTRAKADALADRLAAAAEGKAG